MPADEKNAKIPAKNRPDITTANKPEPSSHNALVTELTHYPIML